MSENAQDEPAQDQPTQDQPTQDQTTPAPAEPGEDYSYKPSLMGAPFLFRLRPDGLEWSRGRHRGLIGYRDITRLRLSYRPVTMQTARYQLEIWSRGTPRLPVVSGSWRSIVEMQPQGPAFRAFVVALHRRLVETGAAPRCERGIAAPLYWVGAVVLGGTALALVALGVRALQAQAWGGAGFIAAFLAVFLWQTGTFFSRNRPGRYAPDDLPAALLP